MRPDGSTRIERTDAGDHHSRPPPQRHRLNRPRPDERLERRQWNPHMTTNTHEPDPTPSDATPRKPCPVPAHGRLFDREKHILVHDQLGILQRGGEEVLRGTLDHKVRAALTHCRPLIPTAELTTDRQAVPG